MLRSTFFGCFFVVFIWVFFPEIFKVGVFVFFFCVFVRDVFYGCLLVVFLQNEKTIFYNRPYIFIYEKKATPSIFIQKEQIRYYRSNLI